MTNFSVDGLVSGLDTTSLINGLMQVERAPLVRIQAKQKGFNDVATAWGDLSGLFSTLRSAADAIRTPTGFNVFGVTSSQTGLLTATAGSTAAVGAVTLRVQAMATAHQLASAGFDSSSALVGAGTATVVGGLAGTITAARADATVAAGAHTLKVTGSTGAVASSGDLTAGVTASGVTLSVSVDGGGAVPITVDDGSYTPDALAAHLNAKLDVAGLGASVRAVSTNGRVDLVTVAHGAARSISVSGGFGFTGATTNGADASVSLDDGPATAVAPGSTVTVAAPGGGAIDVTFGTTVTAGTAKVTVARTTGGSTLAELATALNAAGGPLNAQAITTTPGAGGTRLVLTSTATGTAGALAVDLNGFTGLTAGGLTTLRAAADAQLTIGDPLAGGLTATRSSNTVGDLIQGVSLSLLAADPTKDVTLTVSPDVDEIVKKVKAMVDALNGAVNGLNKHTSFDTKTKAKGVLVGNYTARSLESAVANTVGFALTSGAYRTMGQVGINVTSTGTYTFDESKLKQALATDRDGTIAVLNEGASKIFELADEATQAGGTLPNARSGAEASARALQSSIDSWNARLEAKQAAYRRRFSELETTLSQLRNQSTWLSGQVAGLMANTTR